MCFSATTTNALVVHVTKFSLQPNASHRPPPPPGPSHQFQAPYRTYYIAIGRNAAPMDVSVA